MIWDLIVIGGGAAGYFGAIAHAENGGGRTLILEKTSGPLAKVRISGGGRCNVTHDCLDPRDLVKNYPRGERSLRGALHRFRVEDTIEWFRSRGVELKTEADGRMFPTTDSSQTIVDCLVRAAEEAGVETRMRAGVKQIRVADGFELETDHEERLRARCVLLATGGTRLTASEALALQLGHAVEPAVPSLFTFNIRDQRLAELPGVAVAETECWIVGTKLKSRGPLLVTHSGVSGPGILRLSAWGARELATRGYRFSLNVNWLPGVDVVSHLKSAREESGTRQIETRSPFPQIPKRLWLRFVQAAGVSDGQTWAQLTKTQRAALVEQLTSAVFQVDGKSLNKDEFVTCGGATLSEIDLRTMESKSCPGLYFAGEVIDVDGITGGFNFQNAWTTGYIAGTSSAERNRG